MHVQLHMYHKSSKTGNGTPINKFTIKRELRKNKKEKDSSNHCCRCYIIAKLFYNQSLLVKLLQNHDTNHSHCY